jgi:hypothetical protein
MCSPGAFPVPGCGAFLLRLLVASVVTEASRAGAAWGSTPTSVCSSVSAVPWLSRSGSVGRRHWVIRPALRLSPYLYGVTFHGRNVRDTRRGKNFGTYCGSWARCPCSGFGSGAAGARNPCRPPPSLTAVNPIGYGFSLAARFLTGVRVSEPLGLAVRSVRRF